jgi:DNA polymerase-3 subunit alpha
MAFITLQDETGEASCTIFPTDYVKINLILKEQEIVNVEGIIEWRQGKPQIILKSIKSS